MPHIKLREDLFGITSLLDFRKEAAGPLCSLTHILLRGESTLSQSERELIAGYVSYLNECSFCSQAHEAAACMLPGGSRDQTEGLHISINHPDISDKMKPLLRIAAKVKQSGSAVTPGDIEDAKQNGATDLEIHDTVLIAALFCFYNSYVDGLATVAPADPAYYEALAKRITTRGYTMPSDGYHSLKVQ